MAKIKLTRGDSRTINVPYLSSSGTALDLTGATVFFTVNADQNPTDDSGAVVSKTITSFSSPSLGIATISLTNADTQNITPGEYYYDVQVKDAAGNVTSSKKDKFIITGDVTRRIV